MSTLLTLNGVTFPAALGLPKFPLDGLDGAGVRVIHDYRRTRCLAPGALTEGQAVVNLSRSGVPNGTVIGAANITRDGQGLRFKRTNSGQLSNYIRANGAGAIAIGGAQSFAAVAWVQQRDSADFQGVMGSANNAGAADGTDANNQWGLLINGSQPQFGITVWAWDSTGKKIQFGKDIPMPVGGGIHQVGYAVTHTAGADSHLLVAYDGAIVLDATLSGVRALQAGGYPLQTGTVGTTNQGGMTVYRTALTLLGAGQDTRTAAQVFARDYALNAGQFS